MHHTWWLLFFIHCVTSRTRYSVCAVSKVIWNNRAVRHIHVKTLSSHSRKEREETLNSSSLNSWCPAQIQSRLFTKRRQKCFRLKLLSSENRPTGGQRFRWKRTWHILRWWNWGRSWHDRLVGWLWGFYWTLEHKKYKTKLNLPLSDVM
jgi:hypothetical protein